MISLKTVTLETRRNLLITAALAALILIAACAANARADGGALWHFAPAQAPPPPAGVSQAPYAVPVGEVGQISFWAPNRGLLITGGTEARMNGPVAGGLYAYDGVSWHQLASVCGGGSGRIAWAGPDEFWTIADQRAGQQVAGQQNSGALKSISLCHFLNGQVVGSYAMPLEEPDSYLPMDAGACFSPRDCWFGGEDGADGAFHLHWDGSTVTAIDEPEDHAVTDMVDFNGELYESVQIQAGDSYLPEENPSRPALIHTITPGTGFEDLFMFAAGRPLPNYGLGVLPAALQGLSLATDGSPQGSGATQLWAAANPVDAADLSNGSNPAALTVVRYAGGAWSQILPAANGGSPLPEGASLLGAANTQVNRGSSEQGTSGAVAPEPGTESAWLSLQRAGVGGAEVALLQANGTLVETDSLPEPQDPVGFRGVAGPITCPAVHDCWMATNEGRDPVTDDLSVPGWLFHLSDGSSEAQNEDPVFNGADGVTAYRPPDSGVPVIYPDVPPVDDSLANQQAPPAPSAPPAQSTPSKAKQVKGKPLVEHIKSHFLHDRVLVISFTLTARAHVQLLAHRKAKLVAKTRAESLKPGTHQLSLSLNPKSWPTALQFKATPIGASAPSAGGGGAGSSDTVSTVELNHLQWLIARSRFA